MSNKRNAALMAMAEIATPQRLEPAPAPSIAAVPQQPKPERQTVANSAARVMLYLPPKAKRKVKEIAFYEDRKEHDIYIEALRDYLDKRGHGGLL